MSALASRTCVPAAPRLPSDAAEALLPQVPGWELDDTQLRRTFHFESWTETIRFVDAVAAIAEEQDHHPELHVGWGRCAVVWSTHSAAGVTENDFICAARCDALQPPLEGHSRHALPDDQE
jgi:4a-hydroxytetrahydrobiopterin dehydratase